MKTKRDRRSTAHEAAARNEGEKLINAAVALGDKTFNVCCLKAGVAPTKRQASKFKAGRGAAYAVLSKLD